MAEVTINNTPIHSDSILAAVYGETGPNWSRFHTGIDFSPYRTTETNPPIFSVSEGTVYSKGFDSSLGNNILIQDNNGKFWRYCHMKEPSTLNVGDNVNTGTQLGIMGATGNVTGIHLHLEYATTSTWNYDTFLNPAEQLGIPNQRGTIVHYDGTIPPTPTQNKNKWKWFMTRGKRINLT